MNAKSRNDTIHHRINNNNQNYVRPSQLERPPYYCRICQHQSQSQSEFEEHRKSEFHIVAMAEEKKLMYCKLCRKQLTSVAQMEEHLKSRPHRERMDFVKRRQRGGSVNGGIGGGRNNCGGRGGGEEWPKWEAVVLSFRWDCFFNKSSL